MQYPKSNIKLQIHVSQRTEKYYRLKKIVYWIAKELLIYILYTILQYFGMHQAV